MKIDLGRMLRAISPGGEKPGMPEETAFLHRTTGQIVFLTENEGDADTVCVTTEVIAGGFDRAGVDNSPDKWIEIPKCHTAGNEEEFIREFLAEHGIDAVLE
jgi:hypothetical protein